MKQKKEFIDRVQAVFSELIVNHEADAAPLHQKTYKEVLRLMKEIKKLQKSNPYGTAAEMKDRIIGLEIELEDWKQRLWDKHDQFDNLMKKAKDFKRRLDYYEVNAKSEKQVIPPN